MADNIEKLKAKIETLDRFLEKTPRNHPLINQYHLELVETKVRLNSLKFGRKSV